MRCTVTFDASRQPPPIFATHLKLIVQFSNFQIIKLSYSKYAFCDTGPYQRGDLIDCHLSFFFNNTLADPDLAGGEYFSTQRQPFEVGSRSAAMAALE